MSTDSSEIVRLPKHERRVSVYIYMCRYDVIILYVESDEWIERLH